MNAKRLLFALFAMALVAMVPIASQASEEFVNTHQPHLSNFDVVNRTGSSARSLDMILTNMSCGRIYYYWKNLSGYTPGLGTISMTCTDLGGGKVHVHFTWSGAAVANGGTAHFGLGIEPGPYAHVEKMYWDDGTGNQLDGPVDFAWASSWAESGTGPVLISIGRPDSMSLPGVRIANAQWAQSSGFIDLDHLTYTDPLITALPWNTASQLNKVLHTASDADTCHTGGITLTAPGGVLVRFQLQDTTGTILLGSYVYQTEFNPIIPTLTEWGLIILALLAVAAVVWTVYRRKRVMVPA